MTTEELFEKTMRMFFGDKAYSIATIEKNPKEHKKWMRKLINKFKKHVNNIDASLTHKKPMLSYLNQLEERIKRSNEPSWEMIYDLLRLCGTFLGYRGVYGSSPIIFCTPIYYQDEAQRFTEKIFKHDIPTIAHGDAITKRAQIVKSLHSEGFDTFNIGLILNISEYEVKRLKKNI